VWQKGHSVKFFSLNLQLYELFPTKLELEVEMEVETKIEDKDERGGNLL
jgi:hypothetical protein